jgi:hypothetical protein
LLGKENLQLLLILLLKVWVHIYGNFLSNAKCNSCST